MYPNNIQKTLLAKHFGSTRFIYNWGLAIKINTYEEKGETISGYQLCKLITDLKREPETFWLNEVNTQSLQQSMSDLDSAFRKFIKEKSGFPKFKSKKNNRYSYRIPQNIKIDFKNSKIFLPKIKNINIKIDRTFNGIIKSATIKKVPSGKYFISILVEDNLYKPSKIGIDIKTTIGIDLGIKSFAVFSDGHKIESPKIFKKNLLKLSILQSRLSKKIKGSSNRNKARIKVAKQYEKIKNSRKDFLQKLSTKIINDSQVNTICLETLDIKKMLKEKKLSRDISDASWAEFSRMLEYKADWCGKNILKIGKFEPSSKMCSCGHINNNLKLSDRIWTCTKCQTTHDRDILAANNIKNIALKNSGLGKSIELVELSA